MRPAEARANEPPAPSKDACAHSARVRAAIVGAIADAGGWISFARYADLALHAPGLGYYAAGARKFGSDGDFVTAPEMTPLYGRTWAVSIARVLEALGGGEVIELGAGSGALAADVLLALEAQGVRASRYAIVETSPELARRQRETLAQRASPHLGRVEWLSALPARWRGVVIANEVLDAIAAHVVVRTRMSWHERGVVSRAGVFALEDRPLADDGLRALAESRFPAGSDDYAGELNPAGEALVRTLAQRCDAGAMLLADYGFPARELYHPQRCEGTLMVHYRHRVLTDPLFWPGLCDITAHVDFTAVAAAGIDGGMELSRYTTQAHFLVGSGLLEALAQGTEPGSVPYLKAAGAVQRLLSPAEMGELFKVIAFTRGIGDVLPAVPRDMRGRL